MISLGIIICWTSYYVEQVFICEQKLYTRAQLAQHTKTGDSEVDGSEIERSGFAGHPVCEFCKYPLYGDNELYTHMSREHYSCHICQRYYATMSLANSLLQTCDKCWHCNCLQAASWAVWLFPELWWFRGNSWLLSIFINPYLLTLIDVYV